MAEAFRLGLDCSLVRNTGSYASPTWVAITNVRDSELAGKSAEADVSSRGTGGWEAMVATLKDGSISFEMVWAPADPGFAALLNAWLTRTSIDMIDLDGPITTSGSQGLRANYMVTEFKRSSKLKEAVMASVSIKPTYSANPPTWYVAP